MFTFFRPIIALMLGPSGWQHVTGKPPHLCVLRGVVLLACSRRLKAVPLTVSDFSYESPKRNITKGRCFSFSYARKRNKITKAAYRLCSRALFIHQVRTDAQLHT